MKISTENIQKKSAYIAPMLTEVEFRVERGFAESGSESGIAQQAANMQAFIAGEGDLWAENQNVGGYRTTRVGDDGLAAGEFYIYNTQQEGEGGWF